MEPMSAASLGLGGLLPLRFDVPLDVEGQGLEGDGGSDPVQPSAPDVLEPRHPVRLRYGGLDP